MGTSNWKQKNTSFPQKLGYALEGISHAYRSDMSVRTVIAIITAYIIITLLFVPTLINKGVSISFSLLWLVIELLNTSIEATVDRIGTKYNIISKHAKDLAAGAALIMELIVLVFSIFTLAHAYQEYNSWVKGGGGDLDEYIRYTFNADSQN